MRYKYVFLITCDALRYDALQLSISSGNAPNIAKLVNNSIFFLNAYSNGPGTVQSFPAIMTSNYFLYHCGFYLNRKIKTLAEFFSEMKYLTIGFHSNEFLTEYFGYDRGFNEFYSFEHLFQRGSFQKKTEKRLKIPIALKPIKLFREPIKKIRQIYFKQKKIKIPYADAKTLTNFVIDRLKKHKNKSIFAWIHYMDTHFPYAPEDSFLSPDFSSREDALAYHYSLHREIMSKNDILKLWKLYLGEIRFIDFYVGEFISFLEENDYLESSLIIFTADHGDAFWEHKFMGHDFNNLYNELLRVPLIIFDNANRTRVDDPVFLIDILPTILSYLGADTNKKSLRGIDLRGLYSKNLTSIYANKRFSFADSCAFTREKTLYADLNNPILAIIYYPWKLIYNHPHKRIELYNIKKDPQERKNLATYEKDITKMLLGLIKKHILKAKIFRRKTCSRR